MTPFKPGTAANGLAPKPKGPRRKKPASQTPNPESITHTRKLHLPRPRTPTQQENQTPVDTPPRTALISSVFVVKPNSMQPDHNPGEKASPAIASTRPISSVSVSKSHQKSEPSKKKSTLKKKSVPRPSAETNFRGKCENTPLIPASAAVPLQNADVCFNKTSVPKASETASSSSVFSAKTSESVLTRNAAFGETSVPSQCAKATSSSFDGQTIGVTERHSTQYSSELERIMSLPALTYQELVELSSSKHESTQFSHQIASPSQVEHNSESGGDFANENMVLLPVSAEKSLGERQPDAPQETSADHKGPTRAEVETRMLGACVRAWQAIKRHIKKSGICCHCLYTTDHHWLNCPFLSDPHAGVSQFFFVHDSTKLHLTDFFLSMHTLDSNRLAAMRRRYVTENGITKPLSITAFRRRAFAAALTRIRAKLCNESPFCTHCLSSVDHLWTECPILTQIDAGIGQYIHYNWEEVADSDLSSFIKASFPLPHPRRRKPLQKLQPPPRKASAQSTDFKLVDPAGEILAIKESAYKAALKTIKSRIESLGLCGHCLNSTLHTWKSCPQLPFVSKGVAHFLYPEWSATTKVGLFPLYEIIHEKDPDKIEQIRTMYDCINNKVRMKEGRITAKRCSSDSEAVISHQDHVEVRVACSAIQIPLAIGSHNEPAQIHRVIRHALVETTIKTCELLNMSVLQEQLLVIANCTECRCIRQLLARIAIAPQFEVKAEAKDVPVFASKMRDEKHAQTEPITEFVMDNSVEAMVDSLVQSLVESHEREDSGCQFLESEDNLSPNIRYNSAVSERETKLVESADGKLLFQFETELYSESEDLDYMYLGSEEESDYVEDDETSEEISEDDEFEECVDFEQSTNTDSNDDFHSDSESDPDNSDSSQVDLDLARLQQERYAKEMGFDDFSYLIGH